MLLVGNGRLVTRDPDNPYADEGCVAVKGAEIAEVGRTAALRAKYPDAEFVDAKGGLIMQKVYRLFVKRCCQIWNRCYNISRRSSGSSLFLDGAIGSAGGC